MTQQAKPVPCDCPVDGECANECQICQYAADNAWDCDHQGASKSEQPLIPCPNCEGCGQIEEPTHSDKSGWPKEREAIRARRESAIHNQAFEIRYAVFGGDIEPRSYLGDQMSKLEILIAKALLAKSEEDERQKESLRAAAEQWFNEAQMERQHKEAAKAALALREQRISELEAEVKVDDDLLAERQRLLDAIPECEVHGKNCVPHAIECVDTLASRVKSLRKANEESVEAALVELRALYPTGSFRIHVSSGLPKWGVMVLRSRHQSIHLPTSEGATLMEAMTGIRTFAALEAARQSTEDKS